MVDMKSKSSQEESLLNEPMVKNYKRFVNNDYDETYFLEKVNIIRSFFEQRYDYAINF